MKKSIFWITCFCLLFYSCQKDEYSESSCNCLITSYDNQDYFYTDGKITNSIHYTGGYEFKFYYDNDQLIRIERYDDNSLTAYSLFNYETNESLPYEKKVFLANDNLINRIEYFYNNDGYLNMVKTFDVDSLLVDVVEYLTYDNRGNPLWTYHAIQNSFVKTIYDKKPWFNSGNRIRFPYYQKNNILKKFYRQGISGEWNNGGVQEIRYNSCRFPKETYTVTSDGEEVIVSTFKYNCE